MHSTVIIRIDANQGTIISLAKRTTIGAALKKNYNYADIVD